jgi:ribosomal protein S18 acetylase RimI-like enzyme
MSSIPPFAGLRYELRPATEGQPPLVAEPLQPQQAQELGESFAAIDPWATYGYPVSALVSYFAGIEAGAPRFMLSYDGVLAGAVGVRTGWLRGPYIQFLGILPAMQGNGLGALVLDWVEHQARTAGDRNLWVAASSINQGAIRLYERHGFRDAAWLDDLVYDGRTEILMRKRLF